MKKHLSVLMLFTRSTLYKFLLIIFAMAVGESILFILAFRNAKGFFGLDTILSASHPELVCAICFLLLCALLCLTGCEFGSKPGYTLSRLCVSQRAVLIWQSVHNAGLVFLFWAAQVGIILVFCGVYTAQYHEPQATMLVFYQSSFLHSLLPLADWSRLVYNIALLATLAVTTTCFSVRMRRGQKPLAALVVAGLCIQNATQGIGSFPYEWIFLVVTAWIAFFAINGIRKEADDEMLS